MDSLIALALICVLAGPVIAIGVGVSLARLRRQHETAVATLAARVEALEAQLAGRPAAPAPAEDAAPAAAEEVPAASEPAPAEAAPEPPPLPAPLPAPVTAAPALTAGGFAERLAARWAVWLGGAAMALAAVFLVRYSIEQELLGPGARVTLGMLLGLGLLGAGAWTRTRAPSSVPAALAGAGLIALFASVYAAYALHDLVGPFPAFVALAAIAAAGMALSLLHGPPLAALGQAGAFLVPALVASDQPLASTLFGYLLAVAAFSIALARYRGWRWTAWSTLAGVGLWFAVWVRFSWQDGDSVPLGVFVTLAALLFARFGPQPEPPRDGQARDMLPEAPLAVLAGLAFVVVRMGAYDDASLLALGAVAAVLVAAAIRDQRLDLIPWAAAVSVGAALVTWHVGLLLDPDANRVIGKPTPVNLMLGSVLPPAAERFAAVTALFAALFAAAGLALVPRALRAVRWAGLAVVPPLAFVAAAYWRISDLKVDLPWAAAALAIAGAYLACAAWAARRRAVAQGEAALAVFAVGTLAAIVLALAMSVRLGWLTVALALTVPAIAWVERRVALRALRYAAAAIASGVLVRLLFNWSVVDYAVGAAPVFNALLYTYGVPALAMFAAARMFAARGRDRLVDLLEVAALAFAVALVSLEIRHAFTGGRLDLPHYGLLEMSLHTLVWLGVALALFAKEAALGSIAARWGWRVLGGLAAAQIVLGHLLDQNPVFTRGSVGTAALFDVLALAYAVPAALATWFASAAAARGRPLLARSAAGGALVLAFVWVTLEVKHWFQGEWLVPEARSDAELYAYSAAWLTFGGALLVAGLRSGHVALRYASLAVIGLTVAKVFLVDMAALTGLLRVASFFGLGLSLVALGWVYQRFVLAPRAPEAPPAG